MRVPVGPVAREEPYGATDLWPGHLVRSVLRDCRTTRVRAMSRAVVTVPRAHPGPPRRAREIWRRGRTPRAANTVRDRTGGIAGGRMQPPLGRWWWCGEPFGAHPSSCGLGPSSYPRPTCGVRGGIVMTMGRSSSQGSQACCTGPSRAESARVRSLYAVDRRLPCACPCVRRTRRAPNMSAAKGCETITRSAPP